jgi:hypothetical protein
MGAITGSAGVGIPETNKVVVSTSIDIYGGRTGNVLVGAVDSFNLTMSRIVQRVRELSSSLAGRTVEIVPGPEEASISCTGFLLYTSKKHHLFQRLSDNNVDAGDGMVSLGSQIYPITIVEKYTHPALDKVFKVVYKGCWITNYSKSQNINQAVVAENCTLEVQAVLVGQD